MGPGKRVGCLIGVLIGILFNLVKPSATHCYFHNSLLVCTLLTLPTHSCIRFMCEWKEACTLSGVRMCVLLLLRHLTHKVVIPGLVDQPVHIQCGYAWSTIVSHNDGEMTCVQTTVIEMEPFGHNSTSRSTAQGISKTYNYHNALEWYRVT